SDPEKVPVRFPEGGELAVKRIWQIALPADEPDTIYAGIEPAALFVSRDAGGSFALNQGLHDHEHRKQWEPGGGGLGLHTILPHGGRLFCGISTGGVYRSDDGGASWRARNTGIRVPFFPEGKQYPEFGQCVHKVVAAPGRPERLYLQHHFGVYRSDDAGDSWQAIGGGLPSDFGFPICAHPDDADTVFVLPPEARAVRLTPARKLPG